MSTLSGYAPRRQFGLLFGAAMLIGGLSAPLTALAFSRDAMQPVPWAQKPVEQAVDVPQKGIPMPDPLVNNQAKPNAGSSGKVEFLFDISKAPEPVRKLRETIVEAAASGDLERLRPLMN